MLANGGMGILALRVLGLGSTATYQLFKSHRSKIKSSTADRNTQSQHSHSSSPNTSSTELQSQSSPHLRNLYRLLSDFHKLQCTYSITLQIASFIALYGPPSTTHSIKNPFDESFLLLVSTNGIVPIAITFYTLKLCNKITLYHVLLTSLSTLFASYTGIEIVRLLLKPLDKTGGGGRFRDSGWPAATGGLAPEAICGRRYKITYPKKLRPEKVFLVGAVSCNVIIIGVIARWLAQSFPLMINRIFLPKSTTRSMRKMIHLAASLILIWCAAMEFFFFYQILVPQYDRIVNFNDWGFGQIVGITIWAVVIIDYARHEVGLLREDGS
ncbi:MAG: hypothetical protein L6R41_006416 [Letrouitia leprolyta]|nr:MAG: hypothetical protein L6R41_006416 [Letrouitia leprolyta]